MTAGVLSGQLVGPWSATGAALGLIAGLGLVLAGARVPWLRRPRLDDRLAPYLRDAAPSSLLREPATRAGLGTLQRLLAPALSGAGARIERMSGGSGTVRRRLDQLGTGGNIEQFRAQQVLCGVAGAGAGAALALLLATARGLSVLSLIGLTMVGTLLGVFGRDQLLSIQVRRREDEMLAEFPAIAELLALAVAAGEGAVGALERVSRTCRGELSGELSRTLADARAGASLVQALERLAARSSLPPLARFVDGAVVALERGTPLAEVLRAQANDVREMSRRRLMETGGKKEILMMVPVVFLVLPVTVLFAVYPGLIALDLNL